MEQPQPTFNPVPFQNKVKWGSKCLVYTSYVLLCLGAFQIFCNVIFVLFIDSFTKLEWTDVDGQPMELSLDGFDLFVMAGFKILCALLFIH